MNNDSKGRLLELAAEARRQYQAEIQAGGEPVYPTWIDDVAEVCSAGAPVADERAAFEKCYSAIIKAISSIARADGPDTRREDDPELIYRSPVMDDVVRIRVALDECSAALASAPAPFDRRQLRALVDLVWNEATESTAVPDTPWADRMIDKVFSSLPASAAVAGEADEEDAADAWRRLALQFDGHRMQAIGWLKVALAELPDIPAWSVARAFLSAPPLSGEQVLAERIRAIAAPQASEAVRDAVARAQEWMTEKNVKAFPRTACAHIAGLSKLLLASGRRTSADLNHPVFAFLLGEGTLRGVEFGDRHPEERGAYWWRKDLRAALSTQPGAQKKENDS